MALEKFQRHFDALNRRIFIIVTKCCRQHDCAISKASAACHSAYFLKLLQGNDLLVFPGKLAQPLLFGKSVDSVVLAVRTLVKSTQHLNFSLQGICAMNKFIFALVAVAALSLSGLFTSTASAHGGGGGWGGYGPSYPAPCYRPSYYRPPCYTPPCYRPPCYTPPPCYRPPCHYGW
jgi:hypothetical protein